MKIAYIYPALNTIGGADRVITEKANFFADIYGFEVYIITAHQNNRPLFFQLSEKVKHLDLNVNFEEQYRHSFLRRGFIYFKLLSQYKKKLRSLLKSLQVDFTITTISRDIDFLYSLDDGSKKIAEAHTCKEFLRNFHLLKKKGPLYKMVHKIWTRKLEFAIKKFDSLVVLTQRDAQDWSAIRKATIIPNSSPFSPEEQSQCTNHQAISVGRLFDEKGYDLLIKAWAIVHQQHPEWRVHIYGEGELYGSLTKMADTYNLEESLIFEKPVKNIIEKYIESSFYIMSSRFEGFGMVLIEAMSCGVPVISFNCPDGPATIIEDGVDGFIVENGNTEQLAKKICYLIEHEDIRKKMGLKARESVKRYSPEIVMQQWVNLLNSLKSE